MYNLSNNDNNRNNNNTNIIVNMDYYNQGSSGIRQWTINWNTSPMITKQKPLFCGFKVLLWKLGYC